MRKQSFGRSTRLSPLVLMYLGLWWVMDNQQPEPSAAASPAQS